MKNTSGKLIEARRKQLEISQQELADLIPCSQASIVKWEKGSIPDIEKGLRLQDILGIRLENIFFAHDSYVLPDPNTREIEQSQSAVLKLHPDIQAVIKIMEGIDDDGKTLIRIKAQELAAERQSHLARMLSLPSIPVESALFQPPVPSHKKEKA
jgi:transcriptional regulator with XRE-family HTH domain